MNNEKLDKILGFDPVASAIGLTGKESGVDSDVVGLFLSSLTNKAKETELRSRRDTFNGIPLSEYISIVEDLGFELLFKEKLDVSDDLEGEVFIYGRKKSTMVLIFDTYSYISESSNSLVKSCNSSNLYFRWFGLAKDRSNLLRSSNGTTTRMTGNENFDVTNFPFCVSIDATEALRYKVSHFDSVPGSIFDHWWFKSTETDVPNIFRLVCSRDYKRNASYDEQNSILDKKHLQRMSEISADWVDILDLKQIRTIDDALSLDGLDGDHGFSP